MARSLDDWLIHLESHHPKTIALGLERVAQVQQQLQLNPTFPIIVVGGTNGKGSVCALLEAMLHAAGYRVGCYTSPHLLSYNERVRIGKRQVSDAELCASFEKIEQAREAVSLTYFEFGTLAAMQSFIAHKVDVAILEVGLGGRLDAVNIFDADCAVVTSVDLDHMEYLGDTREKIAFEKAGIFRAGKVAVFGDLHVPDAVRAVAQTVGAKLQCLGEQFSFTAGKAQWNYKGAATTRSALPYPALRGALQLNNASTALAALDALKNQLPVSMDAVRRGLVEVTLPGRFQVVPGRPMLILDVAHNPHAARTLAQNLTDLPKDNPTQNKLAQNKLAQNNLTQNNSPQNKLTQNNSPQNKLTQNKLTPRSKTFAVFAMLKDKDIAGVVQALAKHIDVWLVAGIAAPRGATADEMAAVLRAAGIAAQSFATVSEAVQHAYNQATKNDRIAAFGSFYTVAEVMAVKGLQVS